MTDKQLCIHIFRRDYRLEDNTTLIEACKTHSLVLPIFIFTKKQIDKKKICIVVIIAYNFYVILYKI